METIRMQRAYTPFGYTPLIQALQSLSGFNGEIFVYPLTGYLLGNGYRTYNTRLMRFQSTDSWSPFSMEGKQRIINAYAFCECDPVNRHDPTGHMPTPPKIPRQRTPSSMGREIARIEQENARLTREIASMTKAAPPPPYKPAASSSSSSSTPPSRPQPSPRPSTSASSSSSSTRSSSSYTPTPRPAPPVRKEEKQHVRTVLPASDAQKVISYIKKEDPDRNSTTARLLGIRKA
jgi:RHS repeat-associated protein